MSASKTEARAAKDTARALVSQHAEIAGVGLARHGDGWAVRVNLITASDAALPQEASGVPIVYEIVGRIAQQDV